MNAILKAISLLALVATILPAVLYAAGIMDLPTVKTTALVGTVAWFATCPLWMSRELEVDADQVEI